MELYLRAVADDKSFERVGSDHYFHDVRVQMIFAAATYLLGSNERLAREMRERWLHPQKDRFIQWRNLPRPSDKSYSDIMTDLVNTKTVGVYWIVNHAHDRGLWSVGQVYDVIESLRAIWDYIHWNDDFFSRFSHILSYCYSNQTPLMIVAQPPSMPPSHPPQPSQQPQPRLAGVHPSRVRMIEQPRRQTRQRSQKWYPPSEKDASGANSVPVAPVAPAPSAPVAQTAKTAKVSLGALSELRQAVSDIPPPSADDYEEYDPMAPSQIA